jgi:hypothetical protein
MSAAVGGMMHFMLAERVTCLFEKDRFAEKD